MIDFRQSFFFVLLVFCASMFIACGDDDDNMMDSCPPPTDAFVLSNCLLDIPDMLRPNDQPDVTYDVDLYQQNNEYYYAFKPSAFNITQIEVFDACCNNICRIGFPITEECDWRDTAEDLGTIAEDL